MTGHRALRARHGPAWAREPLRGRGAIALALAASLLWLTPAASALAGGGAHPDGAHQPGTYCPLPPKGQAPVCLTPARAEYGEFFSAVERGAVDDAEAAAVEGDLRTGLESERAYLALSSLSYGYYRLAEQVGRQPDADPALLARLSRWNALLLEAYGESQTDPHFREALRAAALDLHRRTPAVGETCSTVDSSGRCPGAETLVRTFGAIDRSAGLRSPLAELIDRLIGEPSEERALTQPVSGTK